MSDVQSKKTEVKSEEVSPGRRNFLQVASRACYRYLPAIGSASCLIFTTDITNPRILQRWAIFRLNKACFAATLCLHVRKSDVDSLRLHVIHVRQSQRIRLSNVVTLHSAVFQRPKVVG